MTVVRARTSVRRRGTVLGASLVAVAAAVGIAACNVLPTEERPKLRISNGTTLVVAIYVNGVLLGEVPPGGPSPEIDGSDLPPLPWDVDARSPTGRLLTSMRVQPGQVFRTTRPDGGIHAGGAMARVDLSCGRLTIWAGDFAPSGPAPPANPGQPGDCVP